MDRAAQGRGCGAARRAITIDTPLLPPLALVGGLPRVEVGADEAGSIRHGRPVARTGALGEAALVHEGALVAVAEGVGESWQPRVVLGPA